MNLELITLILIFLVAPIIIIYFEGKYSAVKKVGAVLICYGIGLFIGNSGLLPHGAEKYQNLLSNITVPLALPLILFSMDIKTWFSQAGKTFTSLIIGVVSVVVMILAGYWLFRGNIKDIWQVSGMLVAIYTGGTPNMAAMKTALNVDNELYILTHTYEVALGAIYLVFILSIAQKVFLLFLPPYKSPLAVNTNKNNVNLDDEFDSYSGFFKRKTFLPLLAAFGISVAILGISYFLGNLFPSDYRTAAIILLITSFSIGLSFVPKIKAIKKTFQLGMYIILIFCIVVSSMADLQKLSNISFSLFYYVGLVMFGSHFLHAFIARFFKVDADTVIISGIALVCSPPFVPVVAGALKNREIIFTGLVVGIAGYAIGNYLGVFIAYALK
jgi:uncharacterized membrane protein